MELNREHFRAMIFLWF